MCVRTCAGVCVYVCARVPGRVAVRVGGRAMVPGAARRRRGGVGGPWVLAVPATGGSSWSDGAVEMGTGCRADGRRGTSERANASERKGLTGVNRGRGGARLVIYFFGRGKILG